MSRFFLVILVAVTAVSGNITASNNSVSFFTKSEDFVIFQEPDDVYISETNDVASAHQHLKISFDDFQNFLINATKSELSTIYFKPSSFISPAVISKGALKEAPKLLYNKAKKSPFLTLSIAFSFFAGSVLAACSANAVSQYYYSAYQAIPNTLFLSSLGAGVMKQVYEDKSWTKIQDDLLNKSPRHNFLRKNLVPNIFRFTAPLRAFHMGISSASLMRGASLDHFATVLLNAISLVVFPYIYHHSWVHDRYQLRGAQTAALLIAADSSELASLL